MSYYYKKEKLLKQRSWIYRYPRIFVLTGTLIGAGAFWSPIIYTLTHTEEEIIELKEKYSFMRVK